jgi:regulator of nucleoside diphosphate kinase
MTPQTVLITERDRERLRTVVERLRETQSIPTDEIDRLAERLEVATVIAVEDIPRSVVTMNSLVGLRNLDADEKFSCTLACPDEADIERHKVSVAAPLGSGILGARVGDTLACPSPSGVRTLRVERVFYQPEAARDYHL